MKRLLLTAVITLTAFSTIACTKGKKQPPPLQPNRGNPEAEAALQAEFREEFKNSDTSVYDDVYEGAYEPTEYERSLATKYASEGAGTN